MAFIKTEEQDNIINNESDFLAIKAFAGSGKTTTLKEFALAHPNKRILYVAYNKETAAQARMSFPNNVTAKTAHSIAYMKFGKPLEKKLNRKYTLPFKPETIRKMLGLKRDQYSIVLAKELFDIINNYCFSPYKTIKDAIPFKKMSESRETMGIFCDVIWEEMTDPSSRFPTTPDVYLKQFHLSDPNLGFEYILFDEAQDANPLILDLILSQKKYGSKLIFVGDEHQSIYQFRGAKNALKSISPEQELCLTKSFRFGDNIAYVANAILKTLKCERQTLLGFEEIYDHVGEVDKERRFAVITRTNANLFMNAIAAYEKEKSIYFVGGFEGYNFNKILDIEKLFIGDKKRIRDSYIKTFENFEEYENIANYSNDKEMIYFAKVVTKYAGEIEKIINGIKRNTVDQIHLADIILSTAHKSKGLEFEQVILGNDFPNFVNNELEINYKNCSEDEVNILYVAATRAINVLKPNKTLTNVVNLYRSKQAMYDNNAIINEGEQKTAVFISSIKNKFG